MESRRRSLAGRSFAVIGGALLLLLAACSAPLHFAALPEQATAQPAHTTGDEGGVW